ncbi:MAG TPA: RDD family protein [Actinomycetes bacterium]|nr:RDD family protein [Actinomycetes bacterium]
MVTPEAVALEFTTANVGSRILALLIDGVVVGVVSLGGLLALGLVGAALPVWLTVPILIILLPGWYFGYFVACETLWNGRTVGKAALGLRVVTKEGGPVRFRHATVRALLGLVDFGIASGFFAVVFVLVTPDNQRLGDLLAGTLVLRERSGLPAPAPVSFGVPPGLEPYAATLDVSGLRVEQYQAVRTFLLRAPSLPPGPRTSLAVQLASPLVERLRPPPPPGLPAELFLNCVAAAYQRRQRSDAPALPTTQPAASGQAAGLGQPGGGRQAAGRAGSGASAPAVPWTPGPPAGEGSMPPAAEAGAAEARGSEPSPPSGDGFAPPA